MRSVAPPLLPIFRSKHQADLLTVLFLRPGTDHTVTELALISDVPLTTVTFGPHVVIAEEFADLGPVEHVLIYGSWAARYEGAVGVAPSDIDVLLIGSPERAAIYAAAERAEARLGIPVNPTVRSISRWKSGDDPLVASIRAGVTVDVTSFVEGEEREVAPGEVPA